MNDTHSLIDEMGKQARAAAFLMAQADPEAIEKSLLSMADRLRGGHAAILDANARDLQAAAAKNLSPALIDRLTLTPERIDAMAASVESIAALESPVGAVLEAWTRPNGLRIEKTSVPIGVLGMIYESRPNVTIDAAALCLKSRNAVILRGGSESFLSSRALHRLVQESLSECGLPASAVGLVPGTDRALVTDMLRAHEYIDVMIPRGGRGLTSLVMREATMPVFAHLDGNCHLYVHASADPDLARSVVVNAKMRRTGICGAAESLLLDKGLDEAVARLIVQDLLEAGCAVAGDRMTQSLDKRVTPATDADWGAEYLDARISCKYVDDVMDAAAHINAYGSHHTDSILAEDARAADYFLGAVDSAIVMHNASTQFADGGEFGMGAEIGIGTGKLHARGPVGLKQLTTFKYVVRGTGQTRP